MEFLQHKGLYLFQVVESKFDGLTELAGVIVTDCDGHDFRVEFKGLIRLWFHPTEEAVCRGLQIGVAQQGQSCKSFQRQSSMRSAKQIKILH